MCTAPNFGNARWRTSVAQPYESRMITASGLPRISVACSSYRLKGLSWRKKNTARVFGREHSIIVGMQPGLQPGTRIRFSGKSGARFWARKKGVPRGPWIVAGIPSKGEKVHKPED